MFLAAYSVSGREFFESPLPGYVDWIEALMPLIAIMGVAYVQREGGHIRMDILIGALKGRALWAVELITVIRLMLVLMIALVWGSWAHFDRSFDMTEPLWSRDSSIDIGLPIWPTKLIVPVAFSVLCHCGWRCRSGPMGGRWCWGWNGRWLCRSINPWPNRPRRSHQLEGAD